MSKIILVTGTSTGLGIDIAVQLAEIGHTVYATMRNLDKRGALDAAAKAANVSLNVLKLDVQKRESVSDAVARIIAVEGRIDVLINNAGAGFVRTTEQASEDEINWVMDVNFHGVVRATKAVLPHMRAARSGHIINITSVGGLVGQPFNELYCAAKFAVEGYTEALASYVTPSFGINFTAVEPGGIRTEFANNVMAGVAATGGMLDDEYKPILEKYIGGSSTRQGASDAYQDSHECAAVVTGVVANPNPPVRIRTSAWAEELTSLKTSTDPDGKKLQALVIERFLN
ncbi:SDR family oxidoreductase [Devosia rhodophyticola]|uniref:SDR family oxidoreductase n=1 Tax=Devosia rhodophyticola TaxID=3026423 RepID=A0ABY7YZ48_9HYPH|nr:SDR family oxidoreductase [Devosia rhodophyticola]WDR06611.1 SDR family oxidoreductase [Devosia rhodophyticola]